MAIYELAPILSAIWRCLSPARVVITTTGMHLARVIAHALQAAYKILFREGLTIPNALKKIKQDLPSLDGPAIEAIYAMGSRWLKGRKL